MKHCSLFRRSLRWTKLPTAALITLLQRSPVERLVAIFDDIFISSPAGAVLRSGTAAAAALGAIHSLAGATTLVSSTSSPVNATVGQTFSGEGFGLLGSVSEPGSWTYTNLPPGLSFAGNTTSSGETDVSTPVMNGTPTAAGTYNMSLVAYEFAQKGGIQSQTYIFTVVVSANANAPSFSTQPQNATVNVGQAVSFTTQASGSPSYQWQFNANPIAGATSSTYSIASPATSNSGTYTVVATNSSGSTTSAPAALQVVSPTAPPVIQVQPISQTVDQGVQVAFQVTAAGATSYQWLQNNKAITGQTTNVLTLANVQIGAEGTYTVQAINANGTTTSSGATLAVNTPSLPVFTTQPDSGAYVVGQTIVLTAAATGGPTYQWYFNGSEINGATNPIYTIASAPASAAGTYTVVADNTMITPGCSVYGCAPMTTGGQTTSNSAVITITATSPPSFTTQPQSQTVNAGQTVTLTAGASGSPTYQWQKNGTNISGATGATLTLTNVTAASAGTYTVVATNAGGSVTSSSVTLAVSATSAPAFTAQPTSQTVVSGTTVVFSSTASGSPTPSFQWKLNGNSVANATSARLVITGATAASAGTYTCVATNSQGSATSSAATLSFTTTANVGRLVNLSVNTTAGPSPGQVLTVGFVIGGSGTSGSQNLLIRADGPALGALGVPNTIVDPSLAVYNGSTVVVSNDNWGTPASNIPLVNAADSATFAFPLNNPASLDAALVTALPITSGYTVQVSNNVSASGVVLAELYDDTPAGTYTLSIPRLINLSARNQVGANQSLTAGFSIGGATSKTLLIRATGPALAVAPFNLSGTMPDPQLALHTSVNGQDTVLATNAGWGGDPQITAAANSVFAFSLNNSSSADSVLLVTLPPGVYTAVASSVTGTAGVVLVEVYEVP